MQIKDMTTRQKVTAGLFVIVIIFIAWLVYGMFKKEETSGFVATTASNTPMAPAQSMPQPVTLQPKKVTLTEREIALMKLQQQTEEKYLAALNELQMLKVERDIAETNKAIAAAKLDTVTAQKGVVDLLTTPVVAEGTYAQGLANPVVRSTTTTSTASSVIVPTEANYVVISVSQLQQRWNAVLGYQGKLYTVSIGDILPPDGSKVITIDKSGVTLERDTVRKKISLVPVI